MDELTQTVSGALAAVATAASLAELDEQRVRYLGKKGELTRHQQTAQEENREAETDGVHVHGLDLRVIGHHRGVGSGMGIAAAATAAGRSARGA